MMPSATARNGFDGRRIGAAISAAAAAQSTSSQDHGTAIFSSDFGRARCDRCPRAQRISVTGSLRRFAERLLAVHGERRRALAEIDRVGRQQQR
jgi:hypothetical protein